MMIPTALNIRGISVNMEPNSTAPINTASPERTIMVSSDIPFIIDLPSNPFNSEFIGA